MTTQINDNIPIKVLDELKDLLVPLTEDEKEILKDDLLRNGCLSPLVVWKDGGKNLLIDGHNRFNICSENKIGFDIVQIEFNSLDEAKYWIINQQLGRRNLTNEQLSYYRGLKYLQLRKLKGGYEKVLSKGQSELLTSEIFSRELKVSTGTIKREANFAKGINVIGDSNNSLKLKILRGDTYLKKTDIQLLGSNGVSMLIKNEAELYNRIDLLKRETLEKIERDLGELNMLEPQFDEIVENSSKSYDEGVRKIKAQILSYMNKAIDKRDLNVILKLKELIERVENY